MLLVSTLEHVGADNTGYGLAAEDDSGSRVDALRELGRVLGAGGRLLVTVPLGEPGDHGWFRLDDVDGWNGLFAAAGLFVEEQEAYELGERRLARGACLPRRRRRVRRTAGRRRRPCSARSSRRAGCGGSRRPTGWRAPCGGGSRPMRHA